jgi:hypothetical protein
VSYNPWLAILDGRFVRWSPKPPHLTGDDVLVPALMLALNGDPVELSPVGPVVDAVPSDPVAVLAVLRTMGKDLNVSRSGPTITGAPAGAVS